MQSPLLSVAFVIAATQFFKTQFGLAGRWALLCAFVVSLFVGLAPIATAQFPAVQPWLETTIGVVGLFITAAGSFDFLKQYAPNRAG